MQIEDDVLKCLENVRLEWDDFEQVKLNIANMLTKYYNDGYQHGLFDKEVELFK